MFFLLAIVFFMIIASVFKITTWTLKVGIIVACICFGVAWFIFKALFFLTKWLIIIGIIVYVATKIKKIILD